MPSFFELFYPSYLHSFKVMNMDESSWSIVVYQVSADQAQETLTGTYRFIEHLAGVHSLHFIIRDRLETTVIVSLRILHDREEQERIEGTITQHLRNVLSNHAFVINPTPNHAFHQYGAWPWRERMKTDGIEKFTNFYTALHQFSQIIIEMSEANLFTSQKRVEITHLVAGMLGCTQYGQLSTTEMRVGYYDRIQNEYHPYLRSPL